MAKLSGFFMSTLLIVLCLWINVCHYPDAARTSASNDDATPVDVVSPSVAPDSEPVEEETDDQESSGFFADADLESAPKLLDVSASPQTNESLDESAPKARSLTPASFPADGAVIDDAPRQKADPASQPPVLSGDLSNAEKVAPAPPVAAPQTASPAVATPTQSVRRSASNSKPRGAKYVRVPDVEIDAYSGGVRAAQTFDDETRVVGATRAGQTLRVAPSAP
ncbi:MAG: hypothetical protein IJO40_00195 [Thermoguttaceae bacterium]|nr:hypothetical protein [Thermoguttaceae bacterium]